MGKRLEELILAWNSKKFAPGQRNVLAGDEAAMRSIRGNGSVHLRSWNQYLRSGEHLESESARFHLGLLPMPYLGNLRTAKVILLSLNPGIGAHDYFGEFQVPEYRDALYQNLRQQGNAPFPFLAPEHSWHGGAAYWLPRLRPVVKWVKASLGIDTTEAISLCASRLAVLELVPYHSSSFQLSDSAIQRLESSRLARAVVFEELLPRHHRGDCRLIVLRSRERWLKGARTAPAGDLIRFPDSYAPRNARLSERDIKESAELILKA